MKFMLQHRLATPVIQPRMHFFDKEGQPLIGGKVYSFKVGEDIFKPTYRNSEFTATNQNPILLDQAGSALIYVRGSVQLKIYDKSGVFIEEKIVYQQQMRTQFFDKYGKALGGGKVWTYDYQSTIKKPSYENADDALLNPNPVILDENGWGSLSIVGAYRLRQYDKKGVFVGDQDFKRPPIKVLTSKPYPAYFYDELTTDFFLNHGKNKVEINISSLSDDVSNSFALNKVTLRSTVNTTEITDIVNTSFSLNKVIKKPSLNQASVNESASTSFSLTKVKRSRTVIQHNAGSEPVATSFALNKVSKIEV